VDRMSELLKRAKDLEKRLGTGSTFSRSDMHKILDGVVPLRVLLACKVLKGPGLETYKKAYERLVELEEQYGAQIDMAAFGAGGEGGG
jgi:hypothetical protein